MTVEELLNGFTFTELTEEMLAECEHFSCGIDDLSEKRLKRYPGILIGRLAVNKTMAHQGIGTALMNFIKYWLGSGGKTGYRFLIVDARNAVDALTYYEKNGFTYLFPSEEEESKNTRKDKAVVPQATRLMYFDLMDLQPRKNPI